MALFGKKKTETTAVAAQPVSTSVKAKADKKKVVTKTVAAPAVAVPNMSGSASTIIRPRVTEKSGLLSQSGVYTFEVTTRANKDTIAAAVKELYKVTPIKVAIINNPSKNVFVRGRRGVVSGIRKALVTLKKGDKIDFV